MNAHSKYLESVQTPVCSKTAEMWTHVTNPPISICISCVDKPLKAAFDAPVPHVEWAMNPLIPALDSTNFSHRAKEGDENGL